MNLKQEDSLPKTQADSHPTYVISVPDKNSFSPTKNCHKLKFLQ